MHRHENYLDLMEEDEVHVRRHVAELPKRPYSPRFEIAGLEVRSLPAAPIAAR